MFHRLRRRMAEGEWNLVWKLILCTVFSMLFSWAIGDPYGPTNAVTANLCLYTDRGYCGSIRYGVRRILVQILQGVMVFGVVALVRTGLRWPIPDNLLIILACCVAISIGLPLNYRHPYSPLNCTLANATFILACAMVQDVSLFGRRVVECTVGFVIGYLVNYLLLPAGDRYQNLRTLLCLLTRRGIETSDFSEYARKQGDVKKQAEFLREDSGKGLKKHHRSETELTLIELSIRMLDLLLELQRRYDSYSAEVKAQVEPAYRGVLDGQTAHLRLIQIFSGQDAVSEISVPPPSLSARSEEELLVTAYAVSYYQLLDQFQTTLGLQYALHRSGAGENHPSHSEHAEV